MLDAQKTARLTSWLSSRMPNAGDVSIEGMDQVSFGHSAETLLLTLVWREDSSSRQLDVVLRVRPPSPGLLEPYNLERQFQILRALEKTPVPSPGALWYEGTGEILGREFYVMEQLAGEVFEMDVPAEITEAPARLAAMSRSLVDTLVAIHNVRPATSGLQFLANENYLRRELDHWHGEMERYQKASLPALERLYAELIGQQPPDFPIVTLVHGDPKPGNFAYIDDTVSAVYDWELAALGDPLADVAWAEINWSTPGFFTSFPGSLTVEEFIHRYQELTGFELTNRHWYRAFQGFKLAIIMFVGAMLFDNGVSDDLRLAGMGLAVSYFTGRALAEFDIEDEIESGPVTADKERFRSVRDAGSRLPSR
jgi:aminoglycoside phosphotransferase (APT) family kinase protein